MLVSEARADDGKRAPLLDARPAKIDAKARKALQALGKMAQVTLAMQRVALIYNPASGQHSSRRRAAAGEALAVLHAAGVEAEVFASVTPEGATAHTEEAIRKGCDTVVACGGDGTVHAVLQSLVGTQVALGVIPLGTANALAANLGLIGSPRRAAEVLLHAVPVRVPVGRIHFNGHAGDPASHYFLVAAGIGADALLMSRLDAGLKRRFGYALYLVEAARIWATNPFPLFKATFTTGESDARREEEVSQLLAVRVRSFGGVLNKLAPGATLRSERLHLLAFKTRNRLRYMRFLLAVLFGRHTFFNGIELLETVSVECRARNGSHAPIFVEADGEVLGTLPVRMEVVPQALTLLIPANAKP
jgi:YegS/Rv2252/BmrU family lipid kinase